MNDKHKKILRLVLLGGILLLAIGCGLASCKKTKALDVIVGEDNERDWLALLSANLAYQEEDNPMGVNLSLMTGEVWNDDFNILSNQYIQYTWISDYDQRPIITFNFSRANNQANTILDVITYEESAVHSTYEYSLTNQQMIAIFFNPGREGFDNNNLVFSVIMSNSAPQNADTFNLVHVMDYNISIPEEMYYSGNDSSLFRLIRGLSSNFLLASQFTLPAVGEQFIDLFNTFQASYVYTPGLNQLIARAFSGGYTNGYNTGYSEGGDSGSEQAYQDGYNVGYSVGVNRGEQIGYNRGYDDGASGNNAVSSAINVLSSIFGVIGSIFSIELFPHITLGLFLLVPLFFGVLGLILWIWRHN